MKRVSCSPSCLLSPAAEAQHIHDEELELECDLDMHYMNVEFNEYKVAAAKVLEKLTQK